MPPRYGEGGMTRKGHLAIDVDRGVVVGDYPWASLDKDAEHGHSDESYECVYEAKFDEADDQDKFLIFSQNLTNFQVGPVGTGIWLVLLCQRLRVSSIGSVTMDS